MLVQGREYRSVWMEGAVVKMIDQRLLPHQFEILTCPTYPDTAEAIKTMAVRGAGAIGVAAGYAMAQAALEAPGSGFSAFVGHAASVIRTSRPTARDPFWAVDRVLDAIRTASSPEAARTLAVDTAQKLADENANAGERIGVVGEPLLAEGARVLTHCNAGWLAFADWGSALAPIYAAHRRGKRLLVYVTETRPRGQGAKLTAWELTQEGITYVVIADAAAGFFFQRGEIDCVIVGADRIAANGDVANKIGTYQLALLANHHHVPFYVAAPRSTFDLACPTGEVIPLEERAEEEVLWVTGRSRRGVVEDVSISPQGSHAKNPAFDVTPASFVTGFLTEAGLVNPHPQGITQFVHGNASAAAPH